MIGFSAQAARAEAAAIEATALRKKYEGRTVVDIDGLTVRGGEVLALLGPYGAG